MLAEVFAWWVGQISDLVASTRRNPAAEPDAVLVMANARADGGTGIELARRRNGRVTALGRFLATTEPATVRRALQQGRRRGEPVLLALPAPLLAREVTLPLAAEAGLANVLRYEMDRLTPFTADDVYWDWRPLTRDRARGELKVELALTPRATVAPVLDTLRHAGVMPTALEGAMPGGGIRRIGLATADPARAARARRNLRLAAGLCAALAVGVVAVPLVRQMQALQTVADRIDDLQPRVAEVQALRTRIAGAAAGADTVALARTRAAQTLNALALLTDVFPDDTYISILSMRQGRLTMEGISAAATRLIAGLAAQPQIRNPAFTAPVLRGEGGQEDFSLQADYKP
jgi:general secretion pathway protein L